MLASENSYIAEASDTMFRLSTDKIFTSQITEKEKDILDYILLLSIYLQGIKKKNNITISCSKRLSQIKIIITGSAV